MQGLVTELCKHRKRRGASVGSEGIDLREVEVQQDLAVQTFDEAMIL
jgi:hypothetical protein